MVGISASPKVSEAATRQQQGPRDAAISRLPPNDVLRNMYATGRVIDGLGNTRPLLSQISPRHATALYRLVRRLNPRLVVEIGMAYGTSALSVLTSLQAAGGGGAADVDRSESDQ